MMHGYHDVHCKYEFSMHNDERNPSAELCLRLERIIPNVALFSADSFH